jgi:HPt (histidine-containing phosphotransfer) domain-containing protein
LEEDPMIELASRPGATLDRAAIDRLLDTCGDDGAMVAALLGTLFDDAPGLLASLRRSLVEHDREEVRRAAHTLKSHGLTFGAPFLAHVARELELRARDADLDGAPSLVAELEAEFRLAREALDGLRLELLGRGWAHLAA